MTTDPETTRLGKLLRWLGFWKCPCCGDRFDSRDTTYRFRKSPYCCGDCMMIAALTRELHQVLDTIADQSFAILARDIDPSPRHMN